MCVVYIESFFETKSQMLLTVRENMIYFSNKNLQARKGDGGLEFPGGIKA